MIRLFFLQVKGTDCFYFNTSTCKHNIFSEAKKRQIHSQIIKAQRGIIYDRNKNVLAMSLPSKTLCINPSRLNNEKSNSILKELAYILKVPVENIKQTISRNKNKKEYFLKRHTSKHVYEQVSKLSNPNIYFINENKRTYLGGEAFANILGFTDIDDIGQEGIELIKNKTLIPRDGSKIIKRDNIGRVIETIEVSQMPHSGDNIILTLDKKLQIIAYDVLKKYIHKSDAESGSIVLVETASGNILTMANYPSFDPDERKNYKGHKIKNRVIYDLIEPGSTIKPLIVYAGLENNVIDEKTTINTAPGLIEIDNQVIKDWKYLGEVSIRDIISLSSNIGAAKIAHKLSKKQLITSLDEFGFGQSLFLNLPGSKNGYIPTVDNISESRQLSIGYGYGLSVSLMHLAHAYTKLANFGEYTQLKYISNGESSRNNTEPQLDEENISSVLNMMKDVVHSENGTGKRAAVNGYTVYGKTGTVRLMKNGDYDKNSHNALFIGILGDPLPKYVAAVIIRQPKDREGSGGYHAAPVFGEFLQHTMRIIDETKYAGTR